MGVESDDDSDSFETREPFGDCTIVLCESIFTNLVDKLTELDDGGSCGS